MQVVEISCRKSYVFRGKLRFQLIRKWMVVQRLCKKEFILKGGFQEVKQKGLEEREFQRVKVSFVYIIYLFSN